MKKMSLGKKLATGFLTLGAMASLGFSNSISAYEAKKIDEAIQRDVVEYVQQRDKKPDNIDDYFSQLGISFKTLEEASSVLNPKLKEIQEKTKYDFSKSIKQLQAIANLETNILPKYKKVATSLVSTFNDLEKQVNSYLEVINFDNKDAKQTLTQLEKAEKYDLTSINKNVEKFDSLHKEYVKLNLDAIESLRILPAAKTIDDLVYFDGTFLVLKKKDKTEEILKKIDQKINYIDRKIEENLEKYNKLVKSKEELNKVKNDVNSTVQKEGSSVVENIDKSIAELESIIKNYSSVKSNLEKLKSQINKEVVEKINNFEEKLSKMYESAKRVEDKIDVQKRMIYDASKLGNGLILYVGKMNQDYPLLYVVEDSNKVGFKLNYLLGNEDLAILLGVKGETIDTINKLYQTDRKTVQGELKGTTQGIGFDVEVLKNLVGDELAIIGYFGIENYQGQYSGKVADLYLAGDLGISKFTLGGGVNYQKVGAGLQYEKIVSKIADSSNEQQQLYIPLKLYLNKDFALLVSPYFGQALRNGEITNVQGLDLKLKGNATPELEFLLGYNWRKEKDSLNDSNAYKFTLEGIWKNFYLGGNVEINDKETAGYQIYGGWNFKF
ncbi:MAG: hypothetical protein QXR30_02505 [Candidatus Woesearchaeota archaeon]